MSSSEENLHKILREDNINKKNNHNHKQQHYILSRDEKIYLQKMKQVEKDIVNRLYNNNNHSNNDGTKNLNNISYKNTNTLNKSSSQIFGRQQLKSIKYKIDCSSDILNKNSLFDSKDNNNNNSIINDSLKNKEKEEFKVECIKKGEENPWYYKREFITDFNNQLTKHPKVKCSFEEI